MTRAATHRRPVCVKRGTVPEFGDSGRCLMVEWSNARIDQLHRLELF